MSGRSGGRGQGENDSQRQPVRHDEWKGYALRAQKSRRGGGLACERRNGRSGQFGRPEPAYSLRRLPADRRARNARRVDTNPELPVHHGMPRRAAGLFGCEREPESRKLLFELPPGGGGRGALAERMPPHPGEKGAGWRHEEHAPRSARVGDGEVHPLDALPGRSAGKSLRISIPGRARFRQRAPRAGGPSRCAHELSEIHERSGEIPRPRLRQQARQPLRHGPAMGEGARDSREGIEARDHARHVRVGGGLWHSVGDRCHGRRGVVAEAGSLRSCAGSRGSLPPCSATSFFAASRRFRARP